MLWRILTVLTIASLAGGVHVRADFKPKRTSKSVSTVPTPEKAIAQLRSLLKNWKSGPSWRERLDLDDIETQLKAEEPDLKLVARSVRRLSGHSATLKRTQFVQLRRALSKWLIDRASSEPKKIPDLLEAARKEYSPVTLTEVRAARERTLAAHRAVDKLFRQDKKLSDWRDYALEWQDLKNELTSDNKPDIELLQSELHELDSNNPILNRPEITELMRALADYIQKAQDFYSDDVAAEKYETSTETVADLLRKADGRPTRDQRMTVAENLETLERQSRSHYLVAAVRRELARPNLFVEVSSEVVTAGMNKKVRKHGPVRDVIMGTNIYADARTRGKVDVDLQPNSKAADFQSFFKGNVYTKSTGRNGKATIWSTGVTRIHGHKSFAFDKRGWHLQNACSKANTSTCVTGVSVCVCRLISGIAHRIAWKKVMGSKRQAEMIAADHAEDRFNTQFNSEVGKKIGKSNRKYQVFRSTLLRRRQFPPTFDFETTKDLVSIVVAHAPLGFLAAASQPPEVTGSHAVAARIHETMVENAAATKYGGQSLTSEEYEKMNASATKETNKMRAKRGLPPLEEKKTTDDGPSDGKDDDDDVKRNPPKSWVMFFAKRPINFSLTNEGIVIELNLDEYQYVTKANKEHAVTKPVHIKAAYKMAVNAKGGLELTRQGDVEVTFEGKADVQDGVNRIRLRQSFEKVFEEKKVIDQVMLPEPFDAAGDLYWTSATIHDHGWMLMTFRTGPLAGLTEMEAEPGVTKVSPDAKTAGASKKSPATAGVAKPVPAGGGR